MDLAVELALVPIALNPLRRPVRRGRSYVVGIPLTTFVIMPLEALALLFDLAGSAHPSGGWQAGRSLSCSGSPTPPPRRQAPSHCSPPCRGAFALIMAGGLWLPLWRTRWRRLGLAPIAAGAAWALATPAPDLIVTGDGEHLVLRTGGGRLALLRPRAGDYVRETLAELAGAEPEYVDFDRLPTAACSADLCAAHIDRGGRRWRALATRTPQFVRWDQMVRAAPKPTSSSPTDGCPAGAGRAGSRRTAPAPPHRRARDHARRSAARRHRRRPGRPPSLADPDSLASCGKSGNRFPR